MRILASSLACSTSVGSESLVSFQTVNALTAQHQVTLITSLGMRGPAAVPATVIPVHFNDPNDVAAGQLFRYERLQRNIVEKLLREQKFDLVHRVSPSGQKASLLPIPQIPLVVGPLLASDLYPSSFAPVFHPKLPQCYSPRALETRFRNGMARRIFARASTQLRLLENAALILVGTQVALRRLPANLHARCRLLPYSGVEHETFRPLTARRVNKVPQLLYVGRIVPYKGVELLLRAAAAARMHCKFELKIVGSGRSRYKTYCEELVNHLQLRDTVAFLEHQPREALVGMYQSADIFCMPSCETYGIAILEAMSSGCAVIVSDINGPGEIVQPGTGTKVPLHTPDQFIAEYAAQIVTLLENPQLRAKLGDAAREHVIRCHDWKNIQLILLQIYNETFPQHDGLDLSRKTSGTTLAAGV